MAAIEKMQHFSQVSIIHLSALADKLSNASRRAWLWNNNALWRV
jgi:hypothetical protein